MAAVLSVMVFLAHATNISAVHSTLLLRAHAFDRKCGRGHVETDLHANPLGQHLTVTLADEMCIARNDWVTCKIRTEAESDSVSAAIARNTVAILVSCVSSLWLGVQVAGTYGLSAPVQRTLWGKLQVLALPSLIGMTGVAARYMHARRYDAGLDPGEVFCESLVSATGILSLIFPICVLIGWAHGANPAAVLLNPTQLALLGMVLLTHARQDDW